MFAPRRSFVALAVVTAAACAGQKPMSGSVVMKVSETEAHVRLKRDIPVGSQVELYRNKCVSQAGKRYDCRQHVATGMVAQRMGDDHALVTFPEGTDLEEGYKIDQVR
jgi:hypothetical protein